MVSIIPPRPALKVLCVVEVTISAYGTGLGWRPVATNPDKKLKEYAVINNWRVVNIFNNV